MCYSVHMVNTDLKDFPCSTNPDLWFSDKSKDKEQAKIICSECWFKDQCLLLAKENHEEYGIWGEVDFSSQEVRAVTKVIKCRSGKHVLDTPGNCPLCRKETRQAYEKRTGRSNRKRKTRPRKNVMGGYCSNEHLLNESNIIKRSSDGAILCKKCTFSNKTPKRRAFNLAGDF